MINKRTVYFLLVLGCFSLIKGSNALYEDQIKKFDWKLQQIGKVNNAFLDLNSYQPRLIVSTEANVIASLCPKSGEIQWRQILENSPRGDLKLIQTLADQHATKTAVRHSSSAKTPFDILTVQGHSPALIRGWSSDSGNMEFEWSLMPIQIEAAENSFWFNMDLSIYHIIPVFGSHLEITQYVATNGQSRGTTSKITAPWIQKENCVNSGSYYICQEGNQLLSLDLLSANPLVHRKTLSTIPKNLPKAVKGSSGVVVVDHTLISFNDQEKVCSEKISGSIIRTYFNDEPIYVEAYIKNKVLEISAKAIDTCQPIKEINSQTNYPYYYGHPEIVGFDCKTSSVKSCGFVLSTTDEALLYIQQGKIRWNKEEALANIIAAEFIDLPLSDSEGTIENELKSKPDGINTESDIFGAFSRRVLGQIHLLKNIFLHIINLGPAPSATQKAGLIRDSFGLHKMLVLLTKSGKVFGVDNLTGKFHWMYFMYNVENFENDENMKLIVQRTTKHFPKQPICTIITKNKTNKNGVLLTFNPITGVFSEMRQLDYQIRQFAMLAEDQTEFLKGILLLDTKNEVHVLPENLIKQADGMYIFTADKKSATLNGFFIKIYKNKIQAQSIWNICLSGHSKSHEIIAIAGKNPLEHVHSQGRVLNDRSVLYKYINPNLIAVITQGLDNIHKFVMNVHLVDVVSGSIVFSLAHRKVRGPINVVHSENWLAYSYFNDKVRRTEITAIELYEGKVQANSSVWSSLDAPPMPLVERQSYILPFNVEFLKETITERGITNKHVLIGTSGGNIMEMPWYYLDPRRPIVTPNTPREEGVIPYIPELPFLTENMINYNQTIARIKNIFTAPSGLESTCLVLGTGLDIFVTRVSPSKTFDLLKEDFDYYLIATVLVALTVGSLFVKQLSARKILKQAWK